MAKLRPIKALRPTCGSELEVVRGNSDVINDRICDISREYYAFDQQASFYVYRQTQEGVAQTAILGSLAVDDYLNGVVKKHECTLRQKELDCTKAFIDVRMQFNPVILAYRKNRLVASIVNQYTQREKLYDFEYEHVRNEIWKIEDSKDIADIVYVFSRIDKLYIADGHHRCASASNVALKYRGEKENWSGNEDWNYFMAMLIPSDELNIFAFNRFVNVSTINIDFIKERLNNFFTITELKETYQPNIKGNIGMYLNGGWYLLKVNKKIYSCHSLENLDVSILQNYILEPIFGIKNPCDDERLSFFKETDGLDELINKADMECGVVFTLAPIDIEDLFIVADNDEIFPPKTTCFEPKPLSNLFIKMMK